MIDPNRELLESAADLLRPLLGELVFVGGCATGLLMTDPGSGGVRATRDVDTATTVNVTGARIRLITAPYFVATKLVAFHGRGGGDIAGSHDLEDLIAVIDGRPELVGEVVDAADDVRGYIAAEIQRLLDTRAFRDALPGFLLPDTVGQARLPLLLDRLRDLADSANRP